MCYSQSDVEIITVERNSSNAMLSVSFLWPPICQLVPDSRPLHVRIHRREKVVAKLYVSETCPFLTSYSCQRQQFTLEARRQRNRDAQAAFRERRTEYIKELEDKVKVYSEKLQNLEAERSNTADDRLMLRYKNSLLERILLHKGGYFLANSFWYGCWRWEQVSTWMRNWTSRLRNLLRRQQNTIWREAKPSWTTKRRHHCLRVAFHRNRRKRPRWDPRSLAICHPSPLPPRPRSSHHPRRWYLLPRRRSKDVAVPQPPPVMQQLYPASTLSYPSCFHFKGAMVLDWFLD